MRPAVFECHLLLSEDPARSAAIISGADDNFKQAAIVGRPKPDDGNKPLFCSLIGDKAPPYRG
jgi:hypothetical protein